MRDLEEYVFVNENFEKIAEYQLTNDDIAIEQAEQLCKVGMHVTCYKYVTDIFIPDSTKFTNLGELQEKVKYG